MNRLSPDDIRSKYNAASSADDSLYTRGIAALSAAFADLQQAGIDCELTLLGCATEHGFDLNPGANAASWSQHTGGILRIGNSQHLVSIVTQVKLKSDGEDAPWHPCMLLCMSALDIRHQGPSKNLRTHVYHIVDGTDGLTDLQDFIITKAGNDAVIAALDTHGTLGSNNKAAARSSLIKKNQPGT